MKISSNKGFTLIEVVVAFAVLAIVAGTLMQMFVTSTRINQRAYETDKAHALVVKLLEEFKAAPEDAVVETFSELAGALKNETTTTDMTGKVTKVITYTQSLGLDWNVSSMESRLYDLEVVTSEPEADLDGEMSSVQEPVCTLEYFPATGVYTLEVTNDSVDPSKLLFQFTGGTVAGTVNYGNVKDKRVGVLIKAIPPLDGTDTRSLTINIKNKAQLPMSSEGTYDPIGTPGDFELAVYFSGIYEAQAVLDRFTGDFEGSYSYSFIDTSIVSTGFKTMEVKVTRISDGSVIANDKAGKYIVQKN